MASVPVAVRGTASLVTNLCAVLRLWLSSAPETGVTQSIECGVVFDDTPYCGLRVITDEGRVFEVAVREVDRRWLEEDTSSGVPRTRRHCSG